MKAKLYKTGELVAEIDCPDEPPPDVWAKHERSVEGMDMDGELLTVHFGAEVWDKFTLSDSGDGVAIYDYSSTVGRP